MTKMKRRHFAAIVVFIFGMIFFVGTLLKYVPPLLFKALATAVKAPQAPPEDTFRRYVLSPIPKSVTNIKADQPSEFFGYMYTFRFNISRDDLALIINSRTFIRVWNVKYENGILSWRWERDGPFGIGRYGSSMYCYDSKDEPRWFRPGMWDDPETYAFSKHGDLINTQIFKQDGHHSDGRVTTKVLLYNEKEGEAYFIVSRWEQ